MPAFPLPSLRTLILTATLSGALLTTGCAQMSSPGYYAPPAESSSTDATYQAQGGVSSNMMTHAPSQIQIGLDHPEPNPPATTAAAAPAASAQGGAPVGPVGSPVPGENTSAPPVPAAGANARMKDTAAADPVPTDHPTQRAFLPQAQTFVGTFPCLSPSAQCEAQRVTLTLGPNGRWRSRATYLSSQAQPAAPQSEQGCWNVAGNQPAHLLLLDVQGNARAELVASANNVLSVQSMQGHTPTLAYTLTRQPDLDPIDELSKQPPPTCD